MDRKRIMLTNREIMAVRMAIFADIRNMERVLKIIEEDGGKSESIIYEDIETLKSVLDKLDAASYGKKGK